MTETDTNAAKIEQAVSLLIEDADAQSTQPCEMTGLFPDDEREIAALLRALLARAEKAEAAFEKLSYNLGTMTMERNEAQADARAAWNEAIDAALRSAANAGEKMAGTSATSETTEICSRLRALRKGDPS